MGEEHVGIVCQEQARPFRPDVRRAACLTGLMDEMSHLYDSGRGGIPARPAAPEEVEG